MARSARRPRLGRTTRRASTGTVTVEGLQASFESIDRKIRELIERGKTDSSVMETLRRAWGEHFHMSLSPAALRGLLHHYRATSKRRTRKAQRGGMAPIDHTMGQGTTSVVYGSFPVEMGKTPQVLRAFDLDRFYESPISRSCNSTGGFDAPRQTGGSQQQIGGGILDAFLNGHMPASVPRNTIETTISAIQGRTIADAPATPVASHVATVAPTVKPFDTIQVSSITSLAPIFKGF